MTTHASTAQHLECVKAATRIIGDQWTPQLLREIYNVGKVGFCQLQNGADNINPRTLSSRLARLEKDGIIIRCQESTAKRHCYELSQKGLDLIPILDAMAEWGVHHSAPAAV